MASHTIYFPDLRPVPGGIITITGEEAHHALRVKRLAPGDTVRLCNGRGIIADARLTDSRKQQGHWAIDLDVMRASEQTPPSPRLTVLAAPPKGDRLPAMIDGLSQVGASAWAPLIAERTVVEPREGKLERLERIAIESMKQCGRAWVIEIGEPVEFEAALTRPGATVLGDAAGGPYEPADAESITLLIGPEGGWTPAELDAARSAGVRIARFGQHTMRTEVAAVVSAAVASGFRPIPSA
jgi:16S rRNA (uracil1498-N3)-methyltransferase